MTFKVFPHAFGQLPGPFLISASDLREMRITSAGIRYLLDNDKMRALKKVVLEGVPGAILELVKLALL